MKTKRPHAIERANGPYRMQRAQRSLIKPKGPMVLTSTNGPNDPYFNQWAQRSLL